MKWLRLGSLFAVLFTVLPASATSVLQLTAVEQAARSNAIVEATVGAHDTIALTDGRVYTDTTLMITNVINGEAPDVLNIRQRGGEHEGERHYIPGDGTLEQGQKVVAMIRHVEGRWYLTALAQSVWHVEGTQVSRGMDGMALYEDSIKGTVESSTTPLEFTTLESMRTALSHVPVLP